MGVLKGPVKLSNKFFRYSKMSDIQSIVSGEKAYPLKSKQVKSFSCQESNNFWGRSASDVGLRWVGCVGVTLWGADQDLRGL